MDNVSRLVKQSAFGAGAFVLAACVSAAVLGSSETQDSEVFWKALRVPGANEFESYRTFDEMTVAADVVVRGQIGSLEISRTIQGDAEEDVVVMASAKVRDVEILAGEVPDNDLAVEFLIPFAPQVAQEVVSAASSAPSYDAVLFLRDKGGRESGIYRIVSSTGLWVSENGQTRAPLAEEEGLGPSTRFFDELSNIDSTADLADLIRSSAKD